MATRYQTPAFQSPAYDEKGNALFTDPRKERTQTPAFQTPAYQPDGTPNFSLGGTGQVSSASDSRSDSGRDSGDDRRRQEEKVRSGIRAAFSPIFEDYERQLGDLPGRRESQEGLVFDLFGAQQEGIEASRARGESQLAQSREEAKQEQAKSLRQLGENLRGAFKAGNLFLGTRGASDSSAADQLSFALQKANLRRSTDIGNQAQQIFSDINQRQEQINFEADNALRDLGNWRAQQLVSIQDWYAQQKSAIQSAMSQARGQEAAALANLDTQLASQARSALQNLDAQTANFASQVDRAVEQQTSLNQAAIRDLQSRSQGVQTNVQSADPISGVNQTGIPAATRMALMGQGITDDELDRTFRGLGGTSIGNMLGSIS